MPVRATLVIVIGAVVAAFAAVPSQGSTHRSDARLAPQEVCPGAASIRPATGQSATLACLVNWARKRFGRRAVTTSWALQRAARRKANDVIRCGAFSHRACGKAASAGARAEGYAIDSWGENLYLAEGNAGTPLAVVEAWLGSPRHRAVLLGVRFEHVGVAVVPDARVAGIRHARVAVLQLGTML